MIDFSKITKTLDGYDCHYFGTREHNGTTLHCFGVMHPQFGVKEVVYSAEGKRLALAGGQWFTVLEPAFQIVKPKKKVSVTRWVSIHADEDCVDGVYILTNVEKPLPTSNLVDSQQHTFTFEVDE